MGLLYFFSKYVEGFDGALLDDRPSCLPVGDRILDTQLRESLDSPVFGTAVLEQGIAHVGYVAQHIYSAGFTCYQWNTASTMRMAM